MMMSYNDDVAHGGNVVSDDSDVNTGDAVTPMMLYNISVCGDNVRVGAPTACEKFASETSGRNVCKQTIGTECVNVTGEMRACITNKCTTIML